MKGLLVFLPRSITTIPLTTDVSKPGHSFHFSHWINWHFPAGKLPLSITSIMWQRGFKTLSIFYFYSCLQICAFLTAFHVSPEVSLWATFASWLTWCMLPSLDLFHETFEYLTSWIFFCTFTSLGQSLNQSWNTCTEKRELAHIPPTQASLIFSLPLSRSQGLFCLLPLQRKAGDTLHGPAMLLEKTISSQAHLQTHILPFFSAVFSVLLLSKTALQRILF